MEVYLQRQHKLTTARLKKGTAQWFKLTNSARIFINLCWFYSTYNGEFIKKYIELT